jgi:CubicO group peptidase (beta-lactamase class C family)
MDQRTRGGPPPVPAPGKKSPWPLIVLALALACACATAPRGVSEPTESSAPAGVWQQWAAPQEAGFDAGALDAVLAKADEAKAAAVMAVWKGRVVFAAGDVRRKLELHSVRKSLYAALYGIAVARGLVDLNATLSDLGIDDEPPLTADEKRARVVDLLHARSGVYHGSGYAPASQRKNLPPRGSHPPDTFWSYNNWDFNLAGVILERATGKSMGELFDEWIAQPVGMEDFEPGDVYDYYEPDTSHWPALTFRMSTRDLARFGLLWERHGRWNGRRIIPAEWVDRASKPASNTGQPGQGYAMMWWTYAPASISDERYPNASRQRIVLARGTGGQAIFVIPDADLVVVERGDTDNGREVAGPAEWSIVDALLEARTGRPSLEPSFLPLKSRPLASQLPPVEWPVPVDLAPAALGNLLGSYELGPGVAIRVFMFKDRLFIALPGQGEAEFLPLSPTEFFTRASASVRVRFDIGTEGRAEAVEVVMGKRKMTARRVYTALTLSGTIAPGGHGTFVRLARPGGACLLGL